MPTVATVAAEDPEIAANNAEFVWCQLPESVEVCERINPNSAQLKYGYLDSMKNIRRLPRTVLDPNYVPPRVLTHYPFLHRTKQIHPEKENVEICYLERVLA